MQECIVDCIASNSSKLLQTHLVTYIHPTNHSSPAYSFKHQRCMCIRKSFGRSNTRGNGCHDNAKRHPNLEDGSQLIPFHFLRCPNAKAIDSHWFTNVDNPRQPPWSTTKFALKGVLPVTTTTRYAPAQRRDAR